MFERLRKFNATRLLKRSCVKIGVKFEDVDRHSDRFIDQFKDDERKEIIEFVGAIRNYKKG